MLRLSYVFLLSLAALPVDAQKLSSEQNIPERSEEYGSIAFSNDGARFYVAGDGQAIKVRDATTGELLTRFDEQERCYTWALVMSPDGKTLAASHGYSGNEQGLVRLFDAETGELKIVLRGHERVVRSIAFSADSNTVVTCGDDHTLRWWTASTGKEVAKHPTSGVLFQCDVPSGLIAVPSVKSGVEIWDLSKRRQERTICGQSKVYQLSISPGGRLVATSGPSYQDSTIQIWDAVSGEIRESFGAGHNDHVSRLAFSPNGKLLATSNLNGRVTLWDAATVSS